MKIHVYSYAGYMAEQEPRRFTLGADTVEVHRIVDRWQGPDHRYFKVKGHDRATYILRYDQGRDQWDLIQYEANQETDKEASSMKPLTAELTTAGPCRINRIHHPAGEKRPVILLHGAKFEAETWLKLGTLDTLRGHGYPVHALDMPGFGQSPPCEAAKSEVLKGYIEQERLQLPVLVGPSRGGRYALEFLFAHPEMVGGLVLVGSVGIEENRDRFKAIAQPCLLVWGGKDSISPPENGRFLNREIRDSRLVVLDGAPHPCYLEQTERWHQELLDFLRERFG